MPSTSVPSTATCGCLLVIGLFDSVLDEPKMALLLFLGNHHLELLYALRRTALITMQMLEHFSPRLVGPVLAGTADVNSAVNLHLFSDEPELVAGAGRGQVAGDENQVWRFPIHLLHHRHEVGQWLVVVDVEIADVRHHQILAGPPVAGIWKRRPPSKYGRWPP